MLQKQNNNVVHILRDMFLNRAERKEATVCRMQF